MSNKIFLLFIISLILFGISFSGLVSAMVLHAVYDDGSFVPSVIAFSSFVLALGAVITTCLFGKGE